MDKQRGWDKRAWACGLIGGNVCAIGSAWTSCPAIEHRLDAVLRIHLLGINGGEFIGSIFILISLLVLPGIISGIAKTLYVPLGTSSNLASHALDIC